MKAFVLHTLIALTLVSCARRVDLPVVARTESGPNIVILKSSDNPLYAAPIDVFVRQLEGRATIYETTVGQNAHALALELRRRSPDLVFALGTRAALFAKQAVRDTPVVFAMVVNHRRHALEGENVAGISFEVPAVAEFTQFKMIMPALSRTLVLYSDDTEALIDDAQANIGGLGVTLVGVKAADGRLPQDLDAQLQNVDAVWLLNDPAVVTPGNFAQLVRSADARRVPVIASVSDTFAHSGAMMSVSLDFTNVAGQAAAMTQRILQEHVSAGSIGVQEPIGGRLVVNNNVATRLGIVVPDEVQPFINELISDSR